MPTPPLPVPSIEELVNAGQSVLGELGLFTWWKPSSYLRIALEGIHVHADLPWWLSIIATTLALRLATIYVPIMSQKFVAVQSKYRKELDEYQVRMDDARRDGDNQAAQMVFLEQNAFYKSKNIKLSRQYSIMIANGGIFMTQFFAIKKMIAVSYPGFSTGGTLWFTDLTVSDPYYLLPAFSAITMSVIARSGLDFGKDVSQMPPAMKLGMVYGMPVIVFIASAQFGSGLGLYWCTSNLMSLIYSYAFKLPSVRGVLNIPPVIPAPPTTQGKLFPWQQAIKSFKNNKKGTTMANLKAIDAEKFKKAGRGKPVIK